MLVTASSTLRGSRRQRAARGCLCLASRPPRTDGTLARYLCAADSSCYESPPTAIKKRLASVFTAASSLLLPVLCSAPTLLLTAIDPCSIKKTD